MTPLRRLSRRLRHARLLALLFLLPACAHVPHAVDLPPPYEKNGVEVSVERILRVTTKYKGVSGKATNLTDEPISCRLSFRAMNSYMEQVAIAHARADHISPGATWPFRAMFDRSNVEYVEMVLADQVIVGKPK